MCVCVSTVCKIFLISPLACTSTWAGYAITTWTIFTCVRISPSCAHAGGFQIGMACLELVESLLYRPMNLDHIKVKAKKVRSKQGRRGRREKEQGGEQNHQGNGSKEGRWRE